MLCKSWGRHQTNLIIIHNKAKVILEQDRYEDIKDNNLYYVNQIRDYAVALCACQWWYSWRPVVAERLSTDQGKPFTFIHLFLRHPGLWTK